AGSAVPAARAYQAPITLKLIQWNNPPAVSAIAKINAACEKQYPNITVQVTSVPSDQYNQLLTTRLSAKDVDILAQQALVGAPAPWTPHLLKPQWQQFADAGPFIAGGKSGWPLGVATVGILSTIYPSMTALDKGLWTGTIKYTDPKSVEVFAKSQKLLQYMEPGFMGVDYIGQVSQFAAGRAAM